jgi:inorganic phosphate transporter, PiT family
MEACLIIAVGFLAFANGANDNFKGVATLWGAGVTSYWRAITWASVFTFLGSMAATSLGSGLAAKFSGAAVVGSAVVTHKPFLVAVSTGAGATVLLAARLGLPISTTHALTGALIGAGFAAVGLSDIRFAWLGSGIVMPLLFSPLAALLLTVGVRSLAVRSIPNQKIPDCICAEEPAAPATAIAGNSQMSIPIRPAPSVRWARSEECQTGKEIVRFQIVNGMHWLSAAAISFARGLNDTPKIVAVLLIVPGALVGFNYFLVALAIATGGMLGAARVARTMSKTITPMAAEEAVSANLVAAVLVALASPLGLPVSNTQVTSGGIFGIGLLRRDEADWSNVRDILLSWVATLPLGAVLAVVIYKFLLAIAVRA